MSGERRRTSNVARNGQRVRARRSATRGDRSCSLRATRSVLEVGTTHARALTSERRRTDSFRVADGGDGRCIVFLLWIETIKLDIGSYYAFSLFLCAHPFPPTVSPFSRWLVQRTPPPLRALRIGAQAHGSAAG